MWQSDERRKLIRAVKQRREAVPMVAARLGVSVSTAYRWLRVVPKSAIATPTFVELVVDRARAATVVVRVGVAEIEVQAGFDQQLLRDAVDLRRGHDGLCALVRGTLDLVQRARLVEQH